MIKSFLLQYKKYFYIGLAVFLFSAGWAVNGWRLNSRIDKMKIEQQKALFETQRIARELVVRTEDYTYNELNKIRKERDAIQSQLKKLRGTTISGNVVSVLSDYTGTTGSAESTQNDTGTADTTYDAEEQTGIIIDNYSKYKECRQQVISWNQFYDSLLKEFNR